MAAPPAAPWKLACPWCPFFIAVGARGARGNDPGAGIEAAQHMAAHIELHGRSWSDFLAAGDTEPEAT